MMVSKVHSLGYVGLTVYPVEIEVDVQRGLPSFSIVGLADTQVKESRDRIKAGIKNKGYEFPAYKITVNLAPAYIKKEGTHYDLGIALGLISVFNKLNIDFSPYFIIGELSLEGKVREVNGVFPMVLKAKELKKKIIIPKGNVNEASIVPDVEVYGVEDLTCALGVLTKTLNIPPVKFNSEYLQEKDIDYGIDFSDIKGQILAKRALEIAGAGMHNVILIGPPGVGKTMLARCFPTILPHMSYGEILETTKIYSIAGLLDKDNPLVYKRPFRSPHHTSSNVALVGGGTNIKPGEVTLANYGVLFLDELPEFHKDALEALRQPLEDGFVRISRATKSAVFPSRFLLIAAMNPCPCGYFGSQTKTCRCTSYQIQKYRQKISGPLLDRIDLHVEMQEVNVKYVLDNLIESSRVIKLRVERARLIQSERFKEEKIFFNGQMNHRQIKKFCKLHKEAQDLLEDASTNLGFSQRAYDKIIKVAQTIADLNEKDTICPEHISEAIQFRSLDKSLWV